MLFAFMYLSRVRLSEIVQDQSTPNLDQQNQQNAALNPTVELTRTDNDYIEEHVRRHSDISLDWYVPILIKTHVRDLFNSPQLKEFYTSSFELDLISGWVHTYLFPPEDIGVGILRELGSCL